MTQKKSKNIDKEENFKYLTKFLTSVQKNVGSKAIAIATLTLVENVACKIHKYNNLEDLIEILRGIGKVISYFHPTGSFYSFY
jgi:uncharacterized RmlC-like cupin family protein